MNNILRFAMDLDGAFFKRADFPYMGEVNADILWGCKELQTRGHKIHIFTSRMGEAYKYAEERIKALNYFEFDPYEFPAAGKIRADFYVDDRAIQPTAFPRIVESFLLGQSIEDRWEKE